MIFAQNFFEATVWVDTFDFRLAISHDGAKRNV